MIYCNRELEIYGRIFDKLLNYEGLKRPYGKIPNEYNLIYHLKEAYNEDKKEKMIIPKSYMHESSKWSFSGYRYFNYTHYDPEDLEYEDYFKSYDINKSHPYIISQMKTFIYVDMKVSQPEIYTSDKIETGYLYKATPDFPNFLMPKTKLYSAEFLFRCREKDIVFTMSERIKCGRVKHNIKFKEYLELFTDPDEFKAFCKCINYLVGQFAKDLTNETDYITKAQSIDPIGSPANTSISISTSYKTINDSEIEENKIHISTETFKEHKSIETNFPIYNEILDMARFHVVEQLVDNNITPDKIIQISTDCVTLHDAELPISAKIGEFKREKLKHVIPTNIPDDPSVSLFMNKKERLNKTYLNLSYAGCGKTTMIREIIKSMDKSKTIILSPTHKALATFRIEGYNCAPIFEYCDKKAMDIYDNIIVDEISMLNSSCFEIILKFIMNGKNVYCFGDFRQLPPITERDSTRTVTTQNYGSMYGLYCENMIKYMFDEIVYPRDPSVMNRRNNFSFDYYESFQKMMTGERIKEVMKYSVKNFSDLDFTKNEFVITYEKTLRNEWNKIIMKHLGFADISNVGVKIICDLTDNKDSRKYNNLVDRGIYNAGIFTVVDNKTEEIAISDGITQYIISNKELKYFIPAYAINMHKIQGETFSNYYIAEEDIKYFDECSYAYMIVSRLEGNRI